VLVEVNFLDRSWQRYTGSVKEFRAYLDFLGIDYYFYPNKLTEKTIHFDKIAQSVWISKTREDCASLVEDFNRLYK
jgi:exoribonuclease II